MKSLVAFDLDDTLYKERDFVASGYRAIARELASCNSAFIYDEMVRVMSTAPVNPFDSLEEYLVNRSVQQSAINSHGIKWMVETYRNHRPCITLPSDVEEMLGSLKADGYTLALITDGRAVTQSNKIRALGLDKYIPERNISISGLIGAEKYKPEPFERMMALNPGIERYIYVGDNPMKDFVWPNRLGWTTVQMIDDGRNVHSQAIAVPSPDYQPQIRIASIGELRDALGLGSFFPGN